MEINKSQLKNIIKENNTDTFSKHRRYGYSLKNDFYDLSFNRAYETKEEAIKQGKLAAKIWDGSLVIIFELVGNKAKVLYSIDNRDVSGETTPEIINTNSQHEPIHENNKQINQIFLRNIIREAMEGVVDQENTNGTLEPFASIYKNMYSQESVNEFNKLLFNNFPVLNQNGKICYRYKQDNGCYVYLIDDRNEHFKYDLTEDDWWWYRKIEGEYRAFYKWVLVQRHQSYFPMLTNNNSAKALSSLILYLNPKSKIANANYCMQQNTNINENNKQLNTNKTVMKINETQLRKIIKESINKALNESSYDSEHNFNREGHNADLQQRFIDVFQKVRIEMDDAIQTLSYISTAVVDDDILQTRVQKTKNALLEAIRETNIIANRIHQNRWDLTDDIVDNEY